SNSKDKKNGRIRRIKIANRKSFKM
ncbi:uncharacterized protein METZ01_LOCUS498527, partial [marine metagenome]